MKAQSMMRAHGEPGHGMAVGDRWMLAVGKRIDHRWFVEMPIAPRHGKGIVRKVVPADG